MFNSVVRGGQTNLHFLRMARQVFYAGFVFAVFIPLSYLGVCLYKDVPKTVWKSAYLKEMAESKKNFNIKNDKPNEIALTYTNEEGKEVTRKVNDILSDSKIINRDKKLRLYIKQKGMKTIRISLYALAGVFGFWFVLGIIHKRKKVLEGQQKVASWRLALKLYLTRKASDLKIGGVPLLKNSETTHIMVSGTTGVGKSNAINILLEQIRQKNQKTVVVDLTGDFVRKFYREGKDIILNPFDERMAPWHPWAECSTATEFDQFAASIVKEKKTLDDFWDTASRKVISTALEIFGRSGETSLHKMHHLLTCSSLKQYAAFFRGTEAESFTCVDGEKTTLSVRANMAAQVSVLKHIKDSEEPFSIKKWIADDKEDSWLFLTARPDQRETLRPLLTTWIDIAISSIMTLEPNQSRRIWYVIDELAALNRLNSLAKVLAEGRKYGACVILGYQSLQQIIDIYGREIGETILELIGTRIAFRNTGPATMEFLSKLLGSIETSSIHENISYGASTMRDGVNLNEQTKTRTVVGATEIANLPNLTAFLKLPENLPITKIKMKYRQLPKIAEPFVDVERHQQKLSLEPEQEDNLMKLVLAK